ncbi:MAG: VTT domain-containing protein [Myxococcota bacterium]
MSNEQQSVVPRLIGVFVLGAVLFAIGRATGAVELFDVSRLREQLLDAGAWGVVGFIVAFAVGNLLSVPGVVFILASLLAYGQGAGMVLALSGSVVAVMVNFWMVRFIGGRPLGSLKSAWARRVMDRLDTHPVMTIFLLRTVMIASPPLNYALALSSVRGRDYLMGSAAGMVLPIGAYALGLDLLVQCGLVTLSPASIMP